MIRVALMSLYFSICFCGDGDGKSQEEIDEIHRKEDLCTNASHIFFKFVVFTYYYILIRLLKFF